MSERTRIALSVAVGILLGIVLQRFSRDGREAVYPEKSPELLVDPAPGASVARSARVRPTLEQILNSRQVEAHTLAATYLREATIDEVIALLIGLYDADHFLAQTSEMAVLRGLELDPSLLVSAVRKWVQESGNRYNERRLSSLFFAWAQRDPLGALSASSSESVRVRKAVVWALGDSDPAEALEVAKAEFPQDKDLLMMLESKLLVEEAKTDLQGALKRAQEISKKSGDGRALQTVLEVWAKKNPLDALTWLLGDATIGNRYYLLEDVALQASKADPQATRKLIDSVRLLPGERRLLDEKLVAEWAATDPQAALDHVRAEPNLRTRSLLLEAYITRAATPSADVLRLVEDLDITPDLNRNDAVNAAVNRALGELARESPSDAIQTAVKVLGVKSHAFENAFKTIIEHSTGADPALTAEWIFGLPESRMAAEAQAKVVGAWAEAAPHEAAAFLEERSLLGESQLSAVVRTLSSTWSRQNPTAALEWAASISNEGREEVLLETIRSAAANAPFEAASFIDSLTTPAARANATTAVGRELQRADPIGAVDWFINMSDDTDVGKNLNAAAKAAVLVDPATASKRIGEIEPGPRRDHAVFGMIEALIAKDNPGKDFEAAMSWAGTIQDESIAKQAQESIQRKQPSLSDHAN